MVAYTLFGAGYIAYVTFIVAFLRDEGAGTAAISAFWVVLGLAAVASVFAWGPILGRLRGGRGLAVTTAIVAAGALLPLVSSAPVSCSPRRPSSAARSSPSRPPRPCSLRHVHEPQHWTVAIAGLTVAFAFGQTAGPVLAGVLSDGPSGIRAGLTFSVAVLAAGALTALAQSHVEMQRTTEDVGGRRADEGRMAGDHLRAHFQPIVDLDDARRRRLRGAGPRPRRPLPGGGVRRRAGGGTARPSSTPRASGARSRGARRR